MDVRAQRRPEEWSDDAFVLQWLARQEERADERRRQFTMVRALVPRRPEESFRYLNIAAGDGWLDEMLLARFPGSEATLLDGSPVMLERAQQRLRPFGERVKLVRADLATPAWPDGLAGPFDLALSTIAIHNLEDPARVRALYREISTLMADGGFFMNLDYVRAPHPKLGAVYRFASADEESGFMRVRGYRDYAGTLEEHLGWLAEAGFSPVDCFWRELRLALFGGFKGTLRVPDSP